MFFFFHRDAFWPEGVLVEPRTPRDQNTKMRTRVVCKAKMLGSISGKFSNQDSTLRILRLVPNSRNLIHTS